MSSTNELTRAIIDFLYTKGAFAFRVNDTGVVDVKRHIFRAAAKKGISDILAVYNSCFVGIEIKTGNDRLRPEQIGFIKNVQHCGGKCFVVGSLLEFQNKWLDFKKELSHTEIDKIKNKRLC